MFNLTSDIVLEKEISKLTLHAFGKAPLKVEKLNGSFVGRVYRVRTAGNGMILRVCSSDDQTMKIEKNGIKAEIKSLNEINARKMTAYPKVLFADDSKELVNSEYYFVNNQQGVPLYEIADELSDESLSNIYSQIGIYSNKVSQNTSELYGSIVEDNHKFSRWSDALLSMFDDILFDAEKTKTILPMEGSYIRKKFKKHTALINSVECPSLVDLHMQRDRFLIDTKSGDIAGIFGFECPIYADKLIQPVTCSLFDNVNFVDCYNFGKRFSEPEKKRIILYSIFISIYGLVKSRMTNKVDKKLQESAIKQFSESIKYYNEIFIENF